LHRGYVLSVQICGEIQRIGTIKFATDVFVTGIIAVDDGALVPEFEITVNLMRQIRDFAVRSNLAHAPESLPNRE
jgi:hypothetical protein